MRSSYRRRACIKGRLSGHALPVSPSDTDFQIEVPARPQSVAGVRSKLLSWLGHRAQIPERSTGAIALAVTEAVSNAARHAYDDRAGQIRVRGWLDASRLEVEVADEGSGFTPHADTAANGLGMMIIVRLADEVSLHSDDSGTRVCIGFDLGHDAATVNRSRAGRRPGLPRQANLLHANR